LSGARKARLARAAAVAASADWAEIDERDRLSAIATIAGAVRVAFEALGIDPACAARLREAATAEAALAALPDPPELRQTDDDAAAQSGDADSGALDAFRAETERLAGRYASDCTIDLATAPLADLFAWCIAQGALTLQQDSSRNLLLIRCKPPTGPPQPSLANSDSAGETIYLDRTNPDHTTEVREICC
jgi:hypothetical protein